MNSESKVLLMFKKATQCWLLKPLVGNKGPFIIGSGRGLGDRSGEFLGRSLILLGNPDLDFPDFFGFPFLPFDWEIRKRIC